MELGERFPGFFGTDGRYAAAPLPQVFKVPHLRNLYQRVGMFGVAPNPTFNPRDFSATGDQVRGFGFLHDGSHDTVFRFVDRVGFNQENPAVGHIPGGFTNDAVGDQKRKQVEQFVLAFDSNFAPIVGQSITLTADNRAIVERVSICSVRAPRRANASSPRRAVFSATSVAISISATAPTRRAARGIEGARKESSATSRAAGAELTFTCVPPGSGVRIALDRDLDGFYDTDEIEVGSDPADATSVPSEAQIAARLAEE